MKVCVHVSLLCTLVGLLLAPPANHRPFQGALGVAAYLPVPLAAKQEVETFQAPFVTQRAQAGSLAGCHPPVTGGARAGGSAARGRVTMHSCTQNGARQLP